MTRFLKLFFLSLLVCVIQTELARYVRIFTVAPDFMILFLALLTDDYGTFGGFVAGALIGLFYDTTTGYAPAINLVVYTFIGFMAAFIRKGLDNVLRKMKHKRFLEFMIITFSMTMVREIIYIGYLFLVGAEQGYVTFFRMFVCVFYTTLLVL
ncbi:MAG: hypothetical protein IJ088_08580, partial [Clostridia bacterium]|nr:hypothetical protein [Clostridia bacterium]